VGTGEETSAAGPEGEGRRLGAYVLAGDPVWLASSLSRYYPVLDDLVVMVPRSGLGWTGRRIPVDECVDRVRRHDPRGIARIVLGDWQDPVRPLRADTAQRQAAVEALGSSVDWILQIDNDEILPDVQSLITAIRWADERHLGAVEWPMRVLYRRIARGRYLEVVDPLGPRYDYPGPIAIRSGTVLVEARRCGGPFLRPVVVGDDRSLQVRHPLGDGEVREERLGAHEAIVHNSWARSPAEIRRKMSTWGHASGLRGQLYYLTRWLPAPIVWRAMGDFHPFARQLWPRLRPTQEDIGALLLPEDR